MIANGYIGTSSVLESCCERLRLWAWSSRILLVFAIMGFVPIGCLCGALFGILPLHLTVRWVVLPATLLTVLVALCYRDAGRRALGGLLAGIAATLIYDTARMGFVAAGLWGDFIPVIGQLALDDPAASPFWGYGYRYLYDGGAMGITFAMLPWWRSWRWGLAFGVSVCLCLFGTLLLAPGAQDLLFVLSPATAATALVGHVIYGSALGWLLGRFASATPDIRDLSYGSVCPG